MGIECFRVLFPHGMDANEYALQGDAGSEELWGCCSTRRSGSGKASRPRGETVEMIPAPVPIEASRPPAEIRNLQDRSDPTEPAG